MHFVHQGETHSTGNIDSVFKDLVVSETSSSVISILEQKKVNEWSSSHDRAVDTWERTDLTAAGLQCVIGMSSNFIYLHS